MGSHKKTVPFIPPDALKIEMVEAQAKATK
jgi:hypothetical protein